MLRFPEVEETGYPLVFLLARVEDGRPILSMLYSRAMKLETQSHEHIKVDSGAKLQWRLPMFHPGHLTQQQ